MWNQTPTEKAEQQNTATSDNNKESSAVAAAADCGCSASSVGGSSGKNSVEKQLDNKQTSIENNSKTTKSNIFGGKTNDDYDKQQAGNPAINKQKEFSAQSETSDSGFLSGPQSSHISDYSEEFIDNKSNNDNKADEAVDQKKKATSVEVVTDSGIIEDSEGASSMLLKQNVDMEAGISQWTVQSTLASGPINNLNATDNAGSKRGNNTTAKPQQQQQNTAAGNPAISNGINIMNAWEQFYKQNDDGDTPLHLACMSSYVDSNVVTALIRMAPHPCLLNIQNDAAQTPLHLAALTHQPHLLRMLLKAGAEPTVRDRHGNTALHLSCIAGDKQCVRALTEQFSASEIQEAHRNYGHRSQDKTVSSLNYARLPADLEIRNYDGERCVHLAAQSGNIEILRTLVSHGADINAREGKSGRTPLHIAIEACNEDLANFLLDECEKLNLETATYAGLTAYQVACILNKSSMQNKLEEKGAETFAPPDSDYDSSDYEDLDDSKLYRRFNCFVSNPMPCA
ncbi:NF-kappa-B inhibitor cactus [Scaptodrosophila lebanonensis]|uniref:NF-kappa-B inhibitor cactus n=1 Tax=Drosophila lebanonensis TaxID=7225 RepID=A0A6J2U6A5_DROLE|nr:NF-kappa-B inhibitor cactus [Scaptodrosophila lebanonensis]